MSEPRTRGASGSGARDELERFAREHHLHYDVQPELVGAGDDRDVVAVEFRIFAAHGEAHLAAPGCPKCVDLERELASFAQRLVADGDLASRTEVMPAPPALYESTTQRDVDEVALTLRVRCDSPDHQRARGGDDPCTRELRDRLAAVGVQQS